jgi:CHASE3 domain sensor protein
MFKNMKLSLRLAVGFSIVLVLMVIMVIVAVISLDNTQKSMENIVNVNVQKINLINEMNTQVFTINSDIKDLIMETDTKSIDEINKKIESIRSEYTTLWDQYEKMNATEKGRELQKTVKESRENARIANDEVIELNLANKSTEAENLYKNDVKPLNDAWLASLNALYELQKSNNDIEAENAATTSQNALLILIVLGIASVVIGITAALIITRSITKPVKNIVINLTEGAQQVASASGQLSATSQQLAEGNSEQASSIEETSSTLEESASMVSQNSENTRQAAILAAQTKASSDKGNNDMHEMMNSMNEIKKSSDQIAKIIKVIDDIAFQTNMLALNAAVEAARAGDAGMGFAVVAEEVRNLAQRSAQAAKDTAAIIETNITLSENGVGVAKKVGESLAEITVQAKKVNELLDEIAAASQEQAQGISQINKAITQMEAVTQQNAANAEESASASEELSAQAGNLREIVQQLVVLVDGKSAETYTHVSVNNNRPGPKSSGFTSPRALKPAGAGITNLKAGNRSAETLKDGKKTYVVDPEDVIPLNENTGEF